MLKVTVTRKVTRPDYQVFTQHVSIPNADRLTPTTARSAIAIAFGSGTGEVTCTDGYGYKVYANSMRKFQVQDW